MNQIVRLRHSIPTHSLPVRIHISAVLFLLLPWTAFLAYAQSLPITPSGLNTQISDPIAVEGNTQFDITGGTPMGGNLFHSFGEFNVPINSTANFLNDSGLDAANILGRVNGGNPSNIFGTIQTTGFGDANLFLMNPSGIIFGPTASLNVGGSVIFTTANYLRFTDIGGKTGIFHADPALPNLLTSSPVAAFGFLGPNPAAIAVQGSTLGVEPGQSISLVGGNQGFSYNNVSVPDGVSITDGHLSTSGGQANIAGVASPGEIIAATFDYAPNVNGQSFGTLGTVQVVGDSVIDVSGNGGGTVLIRGGQFVLDNSKIFANVTGPGTVTNGVESTGGGIDIVVAQDVMIRTGSLLETSVAGNGTPGIQYDGTHIKANHIEILGSPDFDDVNGPFTNILSDVASESKGGNSGSITLEANSILMKDFVTVRAHTSGAGNGGNIILRSDGDLELNGPILETESLSGGGDAGNIELASAHGNIFLINGPSVSSSSQDLGRGNVGNITLAAPLGEIHLSNVGEFSGAIFTHIEGVKGAAGTGGIHLTAKNLTIENSSIQIDNFTPFQPGDLTLDLTDTLSLSGTNIRSTLLTTTRRSARSADLNITAHDILLTGNSLISTETYRNGAGGTLNIFTNNLELTDGAQITSSSTFNPEPPPGSPEIPSGTGGNITIRGKAGPADSVLIDGQGTMVRDGQPVVVPSGIISNAEGTGPAGNIVLKANTLTIQNGGTISAKTSGTASSAIGGSIEVKATDHVTMIDRASITANSNGMANAGSINITATDGLTMQNSSITTLVDPKSSGSTARGGNIKITTSPDATIYLRDNSVISASVPGSGDGGNVTIDPKFVVLQNSHILTQAEGGRGGNIRIIASMFQKDAASVVNADSRAGVNGTLTIQAPYSPASGKIQPMMNRPLQAAALLNQRCAAATGGQFSSFTVAGRGSLPTEPGGWLSSPLAFDVSPSRGDTITEARLRVNPDEPMGERSLLSLRQISPPGFLTKAFAVDRLAGCRS